MTEHREVVVVGAGPVGLALALGLARRGVDVLVLEKQPATSEHSRAPAIWPRTQEVLDGLGMIDRFLGEGIIMRAPELWDADRDRPLLRLPIEELGDETPHHRFLILPQSRTEALLAAALRETGRGELRCAHEVTGVTAEGSTVLVRFRHDGGEGQVAARFVAGCDGAHSAVRREIGGQLEGTTYPARVALADIRPSPDPGRTRFRFTSRPRPAFAVPIGSAEWRMILPFIGADEQLDDRVRAAAAGLFPGSGFELVWQSTFSIHRRSSSRWVDGRIVLAGDAAHLNSPVGGEGMNAGIIDAAVLTEALAKALADDDPRPLHVYAAQRRRAIEQGVNRFTDRLTRVLLFSGRSAWLRTVLRTAGILLRNRRIRRVALRRMALLDQEIRLLPSSGN